MASCKCGCGHSVDASDFVPGHDQRLRIMLEKEVGGLLALEELVHASARYACGETTAEEFEKIVRRVFASRGKP